MLFYAKLLQRFLFCGHLKQSELFENTLNLEKFNFGKINPTSKALKTLLENFFI